MSRSLLLWPGSVVERIPLQGALRESWEALRASRAKELDDRRKHNAPDDDSTDWAKQAANAAALHSAVEVCDTARAREAASAVLAGTGGKLEPIPEYRDAPELDGIELDVVMLAEPQRALLQATVSDALEAMRKAGEDTSATHASIARASVELGCAQRSYVLASVAAIWLAGERVVVGDAIEAIERTGLLWAVYRVAAEFQGLSPGKLSRFGRGQPSTSSASIAASAQGIGEQSSAAMAMQPSVTHGSWAQAEKAAHAQGAP